jgi:hypothetical protein
MFAFWPSAEKSGAKIYTRYIAFWAGPEQSLTG